jgi:ribosomal protein S18 acetylase RimI-like enzyme
VLCRGNRILGYSYFIQEERKALLGCLYVEQANDTAHTRHALLQAVMAEIRKRGTIRRAEAQFMLHEMPSWELPFPEHAQTYERLFMEAPLPLDANLPAARPMDSSLRMAIWSERYQEQAAYLIEESYRDHLDASINDQYCSVDGARRFLYNIIQYPGCGNFAQEATFAVHEQGTGRMMGCSLASHVDQGVGHITQICTSPAARGKGVGDNLLRESLHQLARDGCHLATLTVTASNHNAIKLYEKLGFRIARRFPAYVWVWR